MLKLDQSRERKFKQMIMKPVVIKSWCFVQLFAVMVAGIYLLGISAVAHARLPFDVNGQPLPSLAPMLELVTPGVVNISTRSNVSRDRTLEDFYRYFYGAEPTQRPQSQPQSLGSGVIVAAKEGLVVTNNHVISGADEILVTLRDGRELSATLIGADPRADIALLKIVANNLTELSWADSDDLRVGDFSVAIGNPFGLGQTVTSGIVSALRRSGLGIEDFEDFIQTDASINPGNSGGALVNLRGELIGINTAIVGPAGGNVGIGFAIPSNMAQDIIDQLLKFGEVRRGKLGVSAHAITDELVEQFSLSRSKGVLIVEVENSSPAADAGLLAGDIITSIDNLPVRTVESVVNRLGLVRLGEEIDLQVVRGNSEFKVKAKVGRLASDNILNGVVLRNRETSGGRKYVRIQTLERGSLLQRKGLRQGDIILSVNRELVETTEDVERRLSPSKSQALLYIQRGENTQYVQIP